MPDLYTTKDQFDGLEWEEYTYHPANADDLVDTHVLKTVPVTQIVHDPITGEPSEIPIMVTDEEGNESPFTREIEVVEELPFMEARGIESGPYLAAQVPFEWLYKLPGREEIQVMVAGGYAVVYDTDSGKVKGVVEIRFNRDYYKAGE